MMKMRNVAIPALLWAIASPALAEIRGCFERVYDRAHMLANSKQIVRGVQMQINAEDPKKVPDDEEDGDENFTTFYIGKKNTIFYAAAIWQCKGRKTLTCSTTEAGEVMELSQTSGGIKLTFKTDILVSSSGDTNNEAITLSKGVDNGVFALIKVSDGVCPMSELKM